MRYVWLILGCLLAALSFPVAQQTPSPLTGKIVHVYDPFGESGDTTLIDISGTGYKPLAEGDNWLRFEFSSLGAALQPWHTGFGIRSNKWVNFGKLGLGTTGTYTEADFAGTQEIWIIVDPHGPATAPPLILTSARRAAFFFSIPGPPMAPKSI